jgi:fused signal recognition particle receptor
MLNFFKKKTNNSLLGKIFNINAVGTAISSIFSKKKVDEATIAELEDLLLTSDLGYKITSDIIKKIKNHKFAKNNNEDEVLQIKALIKDEMLKILLPQEKSLAINSEIKPNVIIFNGVNGAGKTTTIGKIAQRLNNQKQKVLIAACDTFRAAASEQLSNWAERSGSDIVVAIKPQEEPASVAFRALSLAKEQGYDFLLIDTAGRLQNKQHLMDELIKINKVIKKIDSTAPHNNILIIDSTTGQNSQSQVEAFDLAVKIDGLIFTKLDGTAKGGTLITIAQKFNKPIFAIGIGEKIDDLQEFDAKAFVDNILD